MFNRFDSVYQAFEQAAAQHRSRPFLRAPAGSTGTTGEAVEYSYGGARDRVDELIASYAAQANLVAGDRVALAFDSQLEVYLHLLALNALGISVVPLNTASSDDELLHIIGHSDSSLITALPQHCERFARFGICDVLSESQLDEHSSSVAATVFDVTAEAALLYTSGTTGKPKACMLSNEYFLALGAWYNGLGGRCALRENDRLLTPLPPNHMNALCTSFTAMLMCGGCVIQLDRFHPRSWWRTVRDEKATVIHCLGVMTALLLTLPPEEDEDFASQVRFAFGPGSDPRHQSLFEARFGVPLIEAWAMTETGAGAITIACAEPRHVGQRCIGKPSAETELRIVDEANRDVAPGEAGELLVRARGSDPRKRFFSGYYKDPDATGEGWKGGWWHTGDVVRQGEDGSLFFVDRRKNVIRRSGENIAAVEVEAVLAGHAAVTACAVCPVPDEIRGDEVFAVVVSSGSGSTAEAREIFDHCMKHLTYFKAPGYLAFAAELPLTASQKISRGEVAQLARARLQSGDCVDLRDGKKRTRS